MQQFIQSTMGKFIQILKNNYSKNNGHMDNI